MTNHEFNHILGSINALSPEQTRQLRSELDGKLGAVAQQPAEDSPGSIGAMRDAADELDWIVDHAMKNRRQQPWRLPAGE